MEEFQNECRGQALRKEDNSMNQNHEARQIALHRVYRHFKGNYYLVEALGQNADTQEEMVIYRPLYGQGDLWIRPLEEFLSPVDRVKYPDADQEYRFELVEIPSKAR